MPGVSSNNTYYSMTRTNRRIFPLPVSLYPAQDILDPGSPLTPGFPLF